MGIKSTHTITRGLAKSILKEKIDSMTDEQLSNCLEELDESRFRNYWVQEKIDEDEGGPTITSREQF